MSDGYQDILSICIALTLLFLFNLDLKFNLLIYNFKRFSVEKFQHSKAIDNFLSDVDPVKIVNIFFEEWVLIDVEAF
jgi:hypothetical protein